MIFLFLALPSQCITMVYYIGCVFKKLSGLLLVLQVWSSGRIGYIPLYFVATAQVEQERFPQQIPINGQAQTFLYSEQRD